MVSTRAIVTYDVEEDATDPIFKLEDLELNEPGDHELYVQMVATGLCHTDITVALRPGDGTPRVLGHEGAGRVTRVGSKVTKVEINDPVLLSFHGCGECPSCKAGYPARCPAGGASRAIQASFKHKGTGKDVNGFFFGQSSFSQTALVREASVIPAKSLLKDPSSNEELKLFAPLGCGFMTGAGAVANVSNANEESEVLVMGLGGVGMGALMAAKVAGCKTIIALDRIESRLQLAKELGATHTFNTLNKTDLAEDIQSFVKEASSGGYGVNIVVDTTAHLPLINAALGAIRVGGQMLLVGIPRPTDELSVTLSSLLKGALTIRAVLLGDAFPQEFVPKMVDWYRKGQFPIEKLAKYFKAEDVADAVGAMLDGTVVKPILVW